MKSFQVFIEHFASRLECLMKRRIVGLLAAALLATHAVAADQAATAPVALEVVASPAATGDLPAVLHAVTTSNAQIQEAEQDIEIARGQLAQAFAAAWPHGSVMALGAPMPEVRGNAVSSHTNWDRWGAFAMAAGQLAQPLFTFGQISNYQRAAEKQIDAKTQLAQVRRSEVLLTAKEFYYSYMMAGELLTLVDDTIVFLDQAVTSAEEMRKEGKKGGVKPHDLYRLKTALDDLMQKKLLAVQGKQTAEKAVIWISGGEIKKLPRPKLVPEQFDKRQLEDYLRIAKSNRPEYRALTAGIQAYDALADAKQAQSYPTIFVGGFAQATWSSVADKQPSFFLNDPFNRFQGGGGLGLKLDLEFARHAAEASEQRAQAMKLRATEKYAVPGIELQVKKAFWELEQAVAGLEIATRRRDTAKKWFVSNAMGWSVGVTPPKDLLESLEGNAQARRNFIETIFQYNMSLAKLSQAVGKEIATLTY